jgi:glycosyltransferase involved in cell wall biosynthesis
MPGSVQDSQQRVQATPVTAMPFVSVIIPTLNRAPYLERCLTSVFREMEGYPNTEIIVIDGGSTDGSVDILKKYDSKIAYWVSELDSGVSEAANKGLAKARGEIIRLFGADDEVIPGCSTSVVQLLQDNPEIDIVIGHADFYREDRMGEASPLALKQPVGRLGIKDLLRIGEIGWPSPEASFIRRRVIEKYPGYDTKYHYLAYLDFWLRLVEQGVVFEAVPTPTARRYLTPSSDTMSGSSERISAELNQVLRHHGNLYWVLRYHCGGEITARRILGLCRRAVTRPFRRRPRSQQEPRTLTTRSEE